MSTQFGTERERSLDSQFVLKEQYEHANANGLLVVFIRDNKKKKLRSYTVPTS